MAKTVVMPKLGLTMTEGTVSKWLKKVGDEVKEGEPLFDVETDKLTNTIEASASGILRHLFVEDGATVPVLAKIAVIASADEDISALIAEAAPASGAAPASAPAAESSAAGNTVLVIGGGPGGYVAAIRAAQMGGKVTLVEKDELGGTCLNRGCMPTKAMLHTSEIYEQATNSANIGIIGADVQVDWEKVQGFRASVVERLTSGVKALLRLNKVTVVNGEAVFTGPKTVKAGNQELTADKVIICAGSYPIIPGIPGLKESKATIDSTACLSLDHIPESLVVIGGGVIGLELGSVYRRYGTKVTVVEMQPRLLPLMDGELTMLAEAKLKSEGLEILTSTSVVSVADTDKGANVTIKGPDGEKVIEAEKILVCVGRGPNTAGLALDKAGIGVKDGFIQTNEKMETNVPGVYAVGDCTGKLMLAHAAMAMGEVAAENALGGDRVFKPEMSPSCAYIGPEFAGVGYTEERAKELGIAYKVGKFPTSGNGRSLVAGHTDGMIKILSGEKYGEILGVHILAPSATELIEEAALAITLEATVKEFTETIHCHPTVAEAVRECALNVDKKAIHIPNK
ncbi:MAG: dihydrolipoyl dehydrogenase [Oscillospiraceae bacterium]|nr:dihydrolipoyl dehydrogenase [Oscillospiraceae bacterium]